MTNKETILEELYKKRGSFVSGGELAKRLRVSRAAVWKSINSLRRAGYKIESAPREGYRLARVPDLLLPYEIKRELATKVLGKRIEHFREVGSTNDVAKELASQGAEEGTVVIAETQSGGKGRLGREWFSPRGGIWLSVILRPRLSPDEVPKVALMLGVAAAKALRGTGLDCYLKWPNDVLVRGRKVSGILTEMDAEMDKVNYIVAGVGINANNDVDDFPSEFRHSATTVKTELGREVSRVAVVINLLEELEKSYRFFTSGKFEIVLREWRDLARTIGKEVRILTHNKTIEGTALDIDGDGALLLQLKDGRVEKILSGDCIHLRENF